MVGISFEKESDRCLPDTALNAGNVISVTTIAITKASRLMNTDSPRNCLIKEFFSAPRTLRTPTSSERFEERAVERFMKLIQAIISVNNAMDARMYK